MKDKELIKLIEECCNDIFDRTEPLSNVKSRLYETLKDKVKLTEPEVSISFKEKLKTKIEEFTKDKLERIKELEALDKRGESFYDLDLNIIQTKILTLKNTLNDC